MEDICIGEDPLGRIRGSKRQPHCSIERTKTNDGQHQLKLQFIRIRKHANSTYDIISDFRKYKCEVSSASRQGSVLVELAGKKFIHSHIFFFQRCFLVTVHAV